MWTVCDSGDCSDYVRWELSDDVADVSQAGYVILEQHGGMHIPAHFCEAIPPAQHAATARHMQTAQDRGAPELADEVVRRFGGGAAVHLLVNRGLVDTNRRSKVICNDGHRVAFEFLDAIVDPTSAAGRWARQWYAYVRGGWSIPPCTETAGLVQQLHRRLPPQVPIWELHSYDAEGPNAAGQMSRRAAVQCFYACLDDVNGGERPMVPAALIDTMAALTNNHTSLRRCLDRTETLFAVDDPYHVFRGYMSDFTSRQRLNLVTEFRKDLLDDSAGLQACADLSVQIVMRLMECAASGNAAR